MDNRFLRNEMLIGTRGQEILSRSSVIVFGVGGVGSSAVVALARSGVGELSLVDCDSVAQTNINRQLHATSHTVGESKTKAMAERVLSINPNAKIAQIELFYLPETADQIDLSKFDYIVDAVDTVSAKIELAVRAQNLSVPIISCMGTGNKLHPEELKVSDIYQTKVCPLCRVMRRELSKRGVKNLKVVYSEEKPITPCFQPENEQKRSIPGSMPFVPPAAGFLIASQAVLDLLALSSNIGGKE